MAVSLSTGSYPKSDFMISDAAIPMRKMQEEQTERFSGLMKDIGGKTAHEEGSQKDMQTVRQYVNAEGRVDNKRLARAIVKGEIKLEDIPEEMLTAALFGELAELFAEQMPTDEQLAVLVESDSFKDLNPEQAMSEITAVFGSQQTVRPEEIRDKSEELSQLAVQPVATEQQTEGEAVQNAVPQENPQSGGENDTGLFGSMTQRTESREKLPAEEHAEIEFTVTKSEAAETQESENSEDMTMFSDRSAQRSRVVSKSDELDMIKTNDNAAPTEVQPQNVQVLNTDTSVRAEAEIPVRSAEDISRQVLDGILDRAADMKQGTEEYTVTLNPAELGRITVRMTKSAEGAVSVSIAAENSNTLRVIQENGGNIQQSLRDNGVQLEHWQTVSETKQELYSQDYRGSSKNPYRENENSHGEQGDEDESFAEIIASM